MSSRINRRCFIKNSTAVVGAVSLGVTEITWASPQDTCRWALLSDTHISGDRTKTARGFSMTNNLDAVVSSVIDSRPCGIVIDGDIAFSTGEVEDYRIAREYVDKLSLAAPVYMALGNHDNLENFNSVFPETPGAKAPVKGKHITIINAGSIRLILLDSLQITNYTPGLLGYAQRQWLDHYLKRSEPKPTLIFLHHDFGEEDSKLQDDLRFFRIVQPRREVKAVFYGHSHRYHFSKQGDLDLVNLPSTAYHFTSWQSVGWVSAEITSEGASFEYCAVGGGMADDGKVTCLKWRR